jgi:hypothetical protein
MIRRWSRKFSKSARLFAAPARRFCQSHDLGYRKQCHERFAKAGIAKEDVSFLRDTYTFNFAGTPTEFFDAFRKFYGPTMNAFDAAEKNGRAADLEKELKMLFNSHNKSPSKDVTAIPATFLRVTVAVN